jgi:dihydrodiol dehydrogenase / D-xylose 1-dehydrogenase (NADP)
LRWAIVGTREIGAFSPKRYSWWTGRNLHGLASRGRACADTFAARGGARHAYRCYEVLLQGPAVDIVYVATRNEYYREDSLAAIHVGKAVLCEKPFAISVAEGREVVEAARQWKVFCMEAMWMRSSPAVCKVLELVKNGSIGELRLVTAQLGFPRPFDPQSRIFAKPGGGALFDLYPVSFVHALLGPPVRIQSVPWIGPTGVDDQFTALLEYESGRQAVIAASLRARLANGAAVHGTEGTLDGIEPMYFPISYRFLRTAAASPSGRRPQSRFSRRFHGVWSRCRRVLQGRSRPGNTTLYKVVNGYAWEAAAVCSKARKCDSMKPSRY